MGHFSGNESQNNYDMLKESDMHLCLLIIRVRITRSSVYHFDYGGLGPNEVQNILFSRDRFRKMYVGSQSFIQTMRRKFGEYSTVFSVDERFEVVKKQARLTFEMYPRHHPS